MCPRDRVRLLPERFFDREVSGRRLRTWDGASHHYRVVSPEDKTAFGMESTTRK